MKIKDIPPHCIIHPRRFAELALMYSSGELSSAGAKKVLKIMFETGLNNIFQLLKDK